MTRKIGLVDLVLLMMVLFWGANITVIKMALENFHPIVFNCLRFVVASSVLSLFYRRVFRDRLSKKQISIMLVMGVLGNTIYQFFFIYGVKLTFASHAVILLGAIPIFTAIFSTLMKFEQVGKTLWIGILLAFAGVVLIVFGGGNGKGGLSEGIVGDILVLLAAVIWSLYTTFSKSIVSEYSSAHYVVYTVLFGTIFLVPLSLPFFWRQDWTAVGYFEWGAMLYSALFALVFSYSAWYYGVQHIGSTRTSNYANLTPVAGLIITMVFLDEHLSIPQWIGAIVILIGIGLSRFFTQEKERTGLACGS